MTRILVFSGSIRTGSLNAKLAAAAATAIARLDVDVTLISLADYPMPLYNGDDETASGAPEGAQALKRQLLAHQGVFLATPEYNAGITPLLKNAIDWVSRARGEGEAPLAAFRNRAFALGSASPGGYGGYRSQMMTRQVLELGVGALVIPESVAVSQAQQAFDEAGRLKDERANGMLEATAKALVDKARWFG